jgi:DNA polymerase III epsilon subunit-like protein/endogenous inhibitor of DNA gyrase (YacG/DUF329 family)
MLDFTAIDFETANGYRGSPCAVGLVKVRNGVAVDERHWLIRPPELVDWFAPFNVGLHGITPDMVAAAPRWCDTLPSIVEFIASDAVVSHNAGFDIGVIRYACAVDNIEWPELRFLCTLVLARRALRLPSYRLPFVTDACGFELAGHHNALADARAVVGIVRSMAEAKGVADLAGLAAAYDIRIGHMSSGVYRGSVCTLGGGGQLVAPEASQNADPDGYLYGRVVVFTGALMSMTRQIAWGEVVNAGGIPELNTTKRTNVLVLGDFNPATLRPGAAFSGKARKAFELQDIGQDIELMTEADFLQVLDGNNPADVDLDTILDPRNQTGSRPFVVTTRLALGHLEGRDLTPPRESDAYWEWRDRLLTHPDGRATGDEPCVKCGAPVPAKAHWKHRDRHVCGERCNLNLNRWLNRRIERGS